MIKDFYLRCFFCLMLFFAINGIYAQTGSNSGFNVSGKVTDTEGETLVGATVAVKNANGITGGTVTDVQGNFNLKVASESETLVFSYVGYTSQEVKIGKNRIFNVTLVTDAKILGEVVVTGYQTISKERATGSFTKVGSKQLETRRLSSISSLLEGQVAGFNDGLLRGTTSMNGMTTPLYVIDGFPVENTRMNNQGSLVENLPDLNLEDIESITVLKDAAATSIYGARAANGVVVIITKKAKGDKTNVSFSSTLTYTPYKYYTGNLLNSAGIVDIEKEWAATNPNLVGEDAATYASSMLRNAYYTSPGITSILKYYAEQSTEQEMNNSLNKLASSDYNFYDQLGKYAKTSPVYQQYNLRIAKANKNNSFSASVTYKRNQEEDVNSKNNSLGLNIDNSTNITPWLKLDIGTFMSVRNENDQTFNPLSPGYTVLPYNKLMNDDGSYYTKYASERLPEDVINTINTYGLYSMDITTLDEIDRNIGNSKAFDLRSFARISVDLTKYLKYTGSFQYETGTDRYSLMYDKNSYYVRHLVNQFATDVADEGFAYQLPYGNINYTQDQFLSAYNFRQQLDFNKIWNDKHEVTAIMGSETRENKITLNRLNLFGYDPDLLSHTAINGASLSSVTGVLGSSSLRADDIASMDEYLNRFVSFYGNAAYTYKSKYTLSGSLRWDRSNLWGTSSKYQKKPIWSTGASWNVSKEDFFNVDWVDMLKMRVSYGIGGNIAKGSAPYMIANYYNNYNVGGLYGSISSRPNPLLSWELTTTTNIGADFSLFKNRLSGTVEYYNKYGEDLLANTMGVPTEGFGYSTYTMNNGEMRNRGIEASLFGNVIKAGDFRWDASAIFGYNKNEVVYVNVKAPVYFLQLDYPEAYPIIGNPYNSIYAYDWAGLSSEGLPQVYDENNEIVTYQPTTLESIKYQGTTIPKYSGSLGSTLTYKDFNLSFLFVYAGGHKMRNTDLPFLSSSYVWAAGGYITQMGNVNGDIVNRWMKPGDELITDVPKMVFSESDYSTSTLYEIYRNASIHVIDVSNIRLANVSFAYNIPTNLCKKISVQNARLQVNVENPATWAKTKAAKYMLKGYQMPSYVFGIYMNF